MPDTQPWTIDHRVTLFQQTKSRPGPVDGNGDQWVEREATGLMLAVCNCGYTTGWIPKADMPDHAVLTDGTQHTRLMDDEHDPITPR